MLRQLYEDQSGQAITEYGLIMGLIVIVTAALIIHIQIPLKSFYENLQTELITISGSK